MTLQEPVNRPLRLQFASWNAGMARRENVIGDEDLLRAVRCSSYEPSAEAAGVVLHSQEHGPDFAHQS